MPRQLVSNVVLILATLSSTTLLKVPFMNNNIIKLKKMFGTFNTHFVFVLYKNYIIKHLNCMNVGVNDLTFKETH